MKKLLQVTIVAGAISILGSCNNQDSCEDTSCTNNGVCVEGTCICPDGFSGPNCEIESFENGVFVLHEGNFQGGNASLSFLNKNTGIMSNGVFEAATGIPLGDVGQSMEVQNGRGFIVVNNSGKIEVVDLDGFGSLGTITGLPSPRYIAFASNTKAYVSDLLSGLITSFNPQTLVTGSTISITGQSEQMIVLNGSLIVAGTGANYLYKADINTDQLTDSVDVGVGPSNVVLDANDKVWVLTNGGWGTEEPQLVRVNPTTMSVELILNFPTINNYPGNLEINGDGTELYYVDGLVYKMNITDVALPITPFAAAFAYKCGVDPLDDIVYLSDAGDFNSNGSVYRYQSDGTPIDTFAVGVIPAEYAFID
jgi:hypothetical protein